MSLNFQELIPEIGSALNELGADFREVQALILTEDDLKCLLFKRLSELPSLRQVQPTMNNKILASMVHAELSWWGRTGRLDTAPDLTIVDPNHLNILHGYYNVEPRPIYSMSDKRNQEFTEGNRIQNRNFPLLPSKQFEFGGNAIIFELKFIRESHGITESVFREKIQPDYKKIQDILSFLAEQGRDNDVIAYQVVFNKTNRTCKLFKNFLDEFGEDMKHRIIYKSGHVYMPTHVERRRLDTKSDTEGKTEG